jgi:hypothetical protein
MGLGVRSERFPTVGSSEDGIKMGRDGVSEGAIVGSGLKTGKGGGVCSENGGPNAEGGGFIDDPP